MLLDINFPIPGGRWRLRRHLGIVGVVKHVDKTRVLFAAEGYPEVWVDAEQFKQNFISDYPPLKVVKGTGYSHGR